MRGEPEFCSSKRGRLKQKQTGSRKIRKEDDTRTLRSARQLVGLREQYAPFAAATQGTHSSPQLHILLV